MLVEGKVALVSGIGPGMGRDISLLLAEHGADVVLGARTIEKCEAVAEEVRALGRKAVPVAPRHHRRRLAAPPRWTPPSSASAASTSSSTTPSTTATASFVDSDVDELAAARWTSTSGARSSSPQRRCRR